MVSYLNPQLVKDRIELLLLRVAYVLVACPFNHLFSHSRLKAACLYCLQYACDRKMNAFSPAQIEVPSLFEIQELLIAYFNLYREWERAAIPPSNGSVFFSSGSGSGSGSGS